MEINSTISLHFSLVDMYSNIPTGACTCRLFRKNVGFYGFLTTAGRRCHSTGNKTAEARNNYIYFRVTCARAREVSYAVAKNIAADARMRRSALAFA